MSSTSTYPSITPTSYDLILSSTGLPSALLAAAAAALSLTTLHLDANPFYGSHFSSLAPTALPSHLLAHPHLYSHITTSGTAPSSPHFLLDLTGPRALYCADPFVDLLLRSGASHHVEFKTVDGALIYSHGGLSAVPDSREAVFKDTSLGLLEKNQMMRFLKMVKRHFDGEKVGGEEEMEGAFARFLEKQRLTEKIRRMILYGIVLADYDQEDEGCKGVMTTREGLESLGLYSSSIGRFPNTTGAFIYPMYGHGELSQAFCRSAAVKGALYVLRMPVVDVLVDEENERYKGVRLASGQEIFSDKLVMDPSFVVPSAVSAPESSPSESLIVSKPTAVSPLEGCPSESSIVSKPTVKVARGVCITRGSIQKDMLNVLVVFPPRSLYPEQLTTVRGLQLSSNTSVCPSGYFVVHLSTPCEDAILGKEFIHAAISALFTASDLSSADLSSTESGGVSTNDGEGLEAESKPTMIWSCVYVQEIIQASCNGTFTCPMPDANFNYRYILESTTKLFANMYPGEEFIRSSPVPEDAEEDSSSE